MSSKVKSSAQMEPSVFTALRKSGLEVVEFLLGDFVKDPEIFVRKLLSCCSSAVKEVRLPLISYDEVRLVLSDCPVRVAGLRGGQVPTQPLLAQHAHAHGRRRDAG